MSRLSSSRALPILVVLVGAAALLHLIPSQQAFVPPTRRGAGAGLAAALAAASVAGPEAAEAATTAKFSVFGFGSTDAVSDPYNLNDADAISPYSQFSNPKDAIYAKSDGFPAKRILLTKAFERLVLIKDYIKERNPEAVKLATQLGQMRPSLIYLSGNEGDASYTKAREFLQDMSNMGVAARSKRWPAVETNYAKAMDKLEEWKKLVKFEPLYG